VLVGDAGQGVEAGSRPARQEHTFHRDRPLSMLISMVPA
jgi:hypothetical protein